MRSKWPLISVIAAIIVAIAVVGFLISGETSDDQDEPPPASSGQTTGDGSGPGSSGEAPSPDRLIETGPEGVVALGPFDPGTGDLDAAVAAFGEPSDQRRADVLCATTWGSLGLTINFADLGGGNPCGAGAAVGSIDLEGAAAAQAGWATADGVRVGLGADALAELYPNLAETLGRTPEGDLIVLEEVESPVGANGMREVLGVRIESDAVVAIVLSVGAAGE